MVLLSNGYCQMSFPVLMQFGSVNSENNCRKSGKICDVIKDKVAGCD